MAMDNNFGVSFLPNGDQRYQRPGDPTGSLSGAAPVQEAIKVLRMTIPRVVGANPLTPLALLGGQGSQGLPEGLLEQLLRTLGAGPRMQAAPGMVDPNSLGVAGAPSPIARSSGLMPSSYGSGFLGEGALGGRGAPAGGGFTPRITVGTGENLLPTEPTLPPSMSPPPTDQGPSPSNSEDYWQRARDQREAMGRVQY